MITDTTIFKKKLKAYFYKQATVCMYVAITKGSSVEDFGNPA